MDWVHFIPFHVFDKSDRSFDTGVRRCALHRLIAALHSSAFEQAADGRWTGGGRAAKT